MQTSGARSLSLSARSGLSAVFAALLGSGGCTLLVGDELSDKPEQITRAGVGGQGGAGATSTSAAVTSGSSVASSTSVAASTTVAGSTSATSSSSSGGMMCSNDLADCDGKPENGCETNIKTDPKNCGACKQVCGKPKKCDESKCE